MNYHLPARWIAQHFSSVIVASRPVRRLLRRVSKTLQIMLQASIFRRRRVVLGAGVVPMPGWILTDVTALNALVDTDWRRYFAPNSIDAILAEHVWEHLSEEEGVTAARLCLKYLRPGERLRVAVPDGLHPDLGYIDAVKPGGTGPGAMDHKVLYTFRSLQAALAKAGFQTRALEYFDEGGKFHAIDWAPEEGMIHRSARFDERNRNGELRYTSIIVDAISPPS